jgi:hypothetical protein
MTIHPPLVRHLDPSPLRRGPHERRAGICARPLTRHGQRTGIRGQPPARHRLPSPRTHAWRRAPPNFGALTSLPTPAFLLASALSGSAARGPSALAGGVAGGPSARLLPVMAVTRLVSASHAAGEPKPRRTQACAGGRVWRPDLTRLQLAGEEGQAHGGVHPVVYPHA